jgi:hypothetical protein
MGYLREVILYIHLNPVKHTFTSKPADWKWSSYHNFHIERLNLVNALFGNEANYFHSHEDKIKAYDDYSRLESYFLE